MRLSLFVLVCTVCLADSVALADLLTPGHKSVRHEIVFEDSPLFQQHRIVAAPTAGFHGVVAVQPGVPFPFSTKYGTRFYVVPADVAEVTGFDMPGFGAWTSCLPPRSEIKSVPVTSAVARALTTVRLVSVQPSGLVIEEVSHVEMDKSGNPVTGLRSLQTPILIVAAGLVLYTVVVLALRSRAKRRAARAAGTADTV